LRKEPKFVPKYIQKGTTSEEGEQHTDFQDYGSKQQAHPIYPDQNRIGFVFVT